MQKRIAVIQGHPDPARAHYGHALADAYAEGAGRGGHELRLIRVAQLEFPWLRTQEDFNSGAVPPPIREVQRTLSWCDHLLFVFPLWHGTMPSVLKALLEQTFRPGFALDSGGAGRPPRRLLRGKSARIVVTMGMPAVLYRWVFRAHGVKALERSILWGSGIWPIRTSLIGHVDDRNGHGRQRWLERLQAFGERGA